MFLLKLIEKNCNGTYIKLNKKCIKDANASNWYIYVSHWIDTRMQHGAKNKLHILLLATSTPTTKESINF